MQSPTPPPPRMLEEAFFQEFLLGQLENRFRTVARMCYLFFAVLLLPVFIFKSLLFGIAASVFLGMGLGVGLCARNAAEARKLADPNTRLEREAAVGASRLSDSEEALNDTK